MPLPNFLFHGALLGGANRAESWESQPVSWNSESQRRMRCSMAVMVMRVALETTQPAAPSSQKRRSPLGPQVFDRWQFIYEDRFQRPARRGRRFGRWLWRHQRHQIRLASRFPAAGRAPRATNASPNDSGHDQRDPDAGPSQPAGFCRTTVTLCPYAQTAPTAMIEFVRDLHHPRETLPVALSDLAPVSPPARGPETFSAPKAGRRTVMNT